MIRNRRCLMLDELKRIAETIELGEAKRRELALSLRARLGERELAGMHEKALILPVSSAPVSGKICAVDGGLAGTEMHGIDLLAGRAVGVMFEYNASKLVSHAHFPLRFPKPVFDFCSGLEAHEITWHKSLFRLSLELKCALGCLEKFSPDYLLLDGSIAPAMSDKPSDDSVLRERYSEVAALYSALYSQCEARKCSLVGVIKDSRGKRLMEILKDMLAAGSEATNDTGFLHFLLRQGERTSSFSYSSAPMKHQVLRDMGKFADRISAFYLRAAEEERPMRVEMLSNGRSAGEVASAVLSLSGGSKRYAYPPILIEADMCAAMDRTELERACADLCLKLGPKTSFMKLRRDSRPFR